MFIYCITINCILLQWSLNFNFNNIFVSLLASQHKWSYSKFIHSIEINDFWDKLLLERHLTIFCSLESLILFLLSLRCYWTINVTLHVFFCRTRVGSPLECEKCAEKLTFCIWLWVMLLLCHCKLKRRNFRYEWIVCLVKLKYSYSNGF